VKGIILAGGTGSRLFPLTKVTNKHLLPIGKCPMIFYPLAKLKESGITEILIVTGKEHMGDVVNLLGSGTDLGLDLTYRVQDQAGGIAQALGLAENFANGDKVVVILGDNIFEDSIRDFVADFEKQPNGAKILLKQVHDPERYGVAELDGNKVLSIVEKPKNPKSNYCVTGIYMYDNNVFNIVKTLKPSGRGELEVTDVNNAYVHTQNLTSDNFTGWWTDAGTFDSLNHANNLIKESKLDDHAAEILSLK
jgi:glucose-1-phosphate thymidylyltransferase